MGKFATSFGQPRSSPGSPGEAPQGARRALRCVGVAMCSFLFRPGGQIGAASHRSLFHLSPLEGAQNRINGRVLCGSPLTRRRSSPILSWPVALQDECESWFDAATIWEVSQNWPSRHVRRLAEWAALRRTDLGLLGCENTYRSSLWRCAAHGPRALAGHRHAVARHWLCVCGCVNYCDDPAAYRAWRFSKQRCGRGTWAARVPFGKHNLGDG